ncbi:hypothetical protein OK016_05335 [Vibrio chagasii]|nr:hypothetical protein [Vibrio chagasii]
MAPFPKIFRIIITQCSLNFPPFWREESKKTAASQFNKASSFDELSKRIGNAGHLQLVSWQKPQSTICKLEQETGSQTRHAQGHEAQSSTSGTYNEKIEYQAPLDFSTSSVRQYK